MEDRDMQDRELDSEAGAPEARPPDTEGAGSADTGQKEDAPAAYRELSDRHLRLHAEFDNYRKRVARDREDLLKYGNESLLSDLLPVIDNLELALKHASGTGGNNSGLVQGVEMTLKELQRTLEKFGLTRIEAANKCFDPAVHHAMMQVERDDMDEKMVAEELRPGYMYRDKVLRPSLVAVSAKANKEAAQTEAETA